MRLLLDTHAFLWAIDQPALISSRARKAMLDPVNSLALSVASLWEITIKVQAGKLSLPATREYLDAHMAALGVTQVLPVQPGHVYAVLKLPLKHRDPFDRVLVAQGICEDLTIVTRNAAIRQYDVQTLW